MYDVTEYRYAVECPKTRKVVFLRVMHMTSLSDVTQNDILKLAVQWSFLPYGMVVIQSRCRLEWGSQFIAD